MRSEHVRKPRVLIAEDDPSSRKTLCTLLRRLGYDCEIAANGREALEQARDFEPEVILMDLMMPQLDGLETTRILKADAQTREIPILALSGNVTPHGVSAAHQAGCNDFLPKPVVLNDLLDLLRRHLLS